MRANYSSARAVRAYVVLVGFCVFGASAMAAEFNHVRTNRLERWITNVIEVTVPENRFVHEYRTNRIQLVRTNLVNLYATNVLTRTLTNRLLVDTYRTNRVTSVHTNLKTINLTNWQTVLLFRTNHVTQPVTNQVVVQAFLTNFVTAYHTNWRTLNLTNWQTVLVMRTNWIREPVTNVVDIELPAKPSATAGTLVKVSSGANRVAAQPEPQVSKPVAVLTDQLLLRAARAGRPASANQVEVQMKVDWVAGRGGPLEVRQWKVESEDGSVLCHGQGKEFKRLLPVGRYKVEVRAQKAAGQPLLVTRGTLTVTADQVLIAPKPLARR